MNIELIATLNNGTKIKGRLTTDHAASSYGHPVFVDHDGQVVDWWQIMDVNIVNTASEIGRKGGSRKSERKSAASRENGKRGGRPRKNGTN